ncbi:MAG: ArsR/SmtB family transcription factor [Thermoplasmatota archaeon]
MEIPDPIKEDIESLGGLQEIQRRIPGPSEIERSSRIHRALSDPLRLQIAHILDVQPLCVCCIKELIKISNSKLSYHLSQLKEAGLIEGRQEKNWIIYRTTDLFQELVARKIPN